MRKIAVSVLSTTLVFSALCDMAVAADSVTMQTDVSTSAPTGNQSLSDERLRIISEKQRLNAEKLRLLEEEQKLNAEEMKLRGESPIVETATPTTEHAEPVVVDERQKPETGVHTHDGFFLRLAPGFGFVSGKEEVGNNSLQMSASGGLFNFGVGGAITENLILHFDASSVSVEDPTVKINGKEYSSSNTTASSTLLGVGLTYYFPSNSYLTVAVGQAVSKVKVNGDEYSTEKGYGVNVMLGQEWWVSDNWGLGIAGQFLYTSCPDNVGTVKPDFNTTSYGVMLSATYN